MVVSAFFVVFAIGCFLYPVLDPLDFVPNTFYTDNLSIYGLFQKPWFTHTCFGSKCLNLNRGLNKNHVFCVKTMFYTIYSKTVLYTNTMFYTKTMSCSCWACASAVCGLQDSTFHGGRRNTPKAVKFAVK